MCIVIIGLLVCSLNFDAYSQIINRREITRGSDTAEIYISSFWYNGMYAMYSGIFHSLDNGKTITPQHRLEYPPEYGEIFGDSIPGGLNMFPAGGVSGSFIGVSFDYGISFDLKAFPQTNNSYYQYCGGNMIGEMYLAKTAGNYWQLYHLIDFANDSVLVNSTMENIYLFDVGTIPGELYGWKWSANVIYDTLNLVYSNNFGQTFTNIIVDTSLFFQMYQLALSRGTELGEIYLAGKDFSDQWHVFHSVDYGHTWNLRHITGDFWIYDVSFTAGRKPGTFYISKWVNCGFPGHGCLEIYFSRDYGATYEMYYHEIDSTTFLKVRNIPPSKPFNILPNPATNKFSVELHKNPDGADIEVYDLYGYLRFKSHLRPNGDRVDIDAGDWPPGLYLVKVLVGARILGLEKVVVE